MAIYFSNNKFFFKPKTFLNVVYTQLQMDEQPQFDVYLKPGRKDVLKVGDTAVFYMDIITPVDSVASYQLDVTTPNNTLSICRNRVFTTGYNIPCFGNDIDATYLSFEEDGHRDRALLDLGIVRNTGESSQYESIFLVAKAEC